MKKKDLIFGLIICAAALMVWFISQFLLPQNNQLIKITVAGEIFGEYALSEAQKIEIGETNICEILDGKVKMIEASCPDQLCVHQKAVDGMGGTIVCLPNKVVIEAIKDEKLQDEGVDAVVS